MCDSSVVPRVSAAACSCMKLVERRSQSSCWNIPVAQGNSGMCSCSWRSVEMPLECFRASANFWKVNLLFVHVCVRLCIHFRLARLIADSRFRRIDAFVGSAKRHVARARDTEVVQYGPESQVIGRSGSSAPPPDLVSPHPDSLMPDQLSWLRIRGRLVTSLYLETCSFI